MALITSTTVAAQGDVYKRSQSYEWPTDPLVVRKLKQWQDLKFDKNLSTIQRVVLGVVQAVQSHTI